MRIDIRIVIIIIVVGFLLLKRQNVIEGFDDCKNENIFVSVASYRDVKCTQTVRSIFEEADAPERVFVGICQQNDSENDSDCVEGVKGEWKRNIRMIRLAHYDAKGPTWARYLCSTLWDGEKYFLQIDSHSLFAKGWDTKLIEMIKKLKKMGIKKPLLSHYPKLYEEHKKDDRTHIPVICKSFFNDAKMISFEGAQAMNVADGRFIQTAYVAAGMFFAESTFLKEVPFDPNLPYLFVGEEILHSVRFWTNGWDIYTPSENVVYHYYTREGEPKIWNDSKHYDTTDAMNKVRALLGLKNAMGIANHINQNMDVYGLGKERSLQDYFKFTGIDVENDKVNKSFCD